MFIDKTMIKNGNKISHNYSLKLVIRQAQKCNKIYYLSKHIEIKINR